MKLLVFLHNFIFFSKSMTTEQVRVLDEDFNSEERDEAEKKIQEAQENHQRPKTLCTFEGCQTQSWKRNGAYCKRHAEKKLFEALADCHLNERKLNMIRTTLFSQLKRDHPVVLVGLRGKPLAILHNFAKEQGWMHFGFTNLYTLPLTISLYCPKCRQRIDPQKKQEATLTFNSNNHYWQYNCVTCNRFLWSNEPRETEKCRYYELYQCNSIGISMNPKEYAQENIQFYARCNTSLERIMKARDYLKSKEAKP